MIVAVVSVVMMFHKYVSCYCGNMMPEFEKVNDEWMAIQFCSQGCKDKYGIKNEFGEQCERCIICNKLISIENEVIPLTDGCCYHCMWEE